MSCERVSTKPLLDRFILEMFAELHLRLLLMQVWMNSLARHSAEVFNRLRRLVLVQLVPLEVFIRAKMLDKFLCIIDSTLQLFSATF